MWEGKDRGQKKPVELRGRRIPSLLLRERQTPLQGEEKAGGLVAVGSER